MPLPSAGGNQQYSAVQWTPTAKATRNCSVGSWMEFPSSLVTLASLSAQVQRYHPSSRAVAVATVQGRLSDSSSFLLISVCGHLFSEACCCLYKQKAKWWFRHCRTCYFSKHYCPGTTTNSGSFDRELCTFP